jgi:hypothetical protein
MFVVLLAMLITVNYVRADEPPPDAGQSEEPAVQPGENVADFVKGHGGAPKNKNSVFNKNIKMKTPIANGNGCPAGTFGAALTEDKRTLSIAFDNYLVQAGGSASTNRDIKQCGVTVPLEVPAGMQVMIVKIDYRGFNSLTKGARTRYVTMYSFIDADSNKQVGKRIRRKMDFKGPLEGEYTLSSDVSSQPVWSKCGKNVNLRIDTRAAAAANKKAEAMGSIDTIDASVGEDTVAYSLLWQQCK